MDTKGGDGGRSLVRAAIDAFALDLRGRTVFTEAATGAFGCTPALALAAGASRVFAIAKDSRFGTCDEAARNAFAWARSAGDAERLTIVHDHAAIGDADIVTNTGFVRPIDADVIARMSPWAVVPLMWETWEYRPTELDLSACIARDIMVLGTNEADPRLQTMRLVGILVTRLLAEANVATEDATIVVLGGGRIGSAIARVLHEHGAHVRILSHVAVEDDVAIFRSHGLEGATALVVADHHSRHTLIGPGGDFTVDDVVRTRERMPIVHVSGLVDARGLRARGCFVVPETIATVPATMSVNTSYLGPKPVVELHAAGLAVGAVMAHARRQHASIAAARRLALRDPLCQDFTDAQYAHFAAKQVG